MADPAAAYELNNPPVIAELLDGEIVAIDLDAGNYFSLRGTAAAAFSALTAGAAPERVMRSVTLGADRAALLPPLLSFVDRLLADKLIRLRQVASAAPDPPPLAPWTADELVYEIFTDMQNLLGLDPVHEADQQLGWPTTAPTPGS